MATLREAWLALARMWDKTERCGCGCGRRVVAPNAAGLCSAIGILANREEITRDQERVMLGALPTEGVPVFVEGVRPFLWPTDEDGAKTRAEFCRAQAAKCRG